MTFQNKKIVFVLFLFALTEVVSWTIDLPEVRKHFFEHHERHKAREMEKIDIDYKEMEDKDQKFYSNIEGNSKHNTEEHKMHDYHEEDSDEYDQSYMEKKVQNLVNDGGLYLEGLRLALEDFISLIEDCNRNNMTMSQAMGFSPPVMPTRPNMTTMFNTTMPPFPSFNSSDWPMSMGRRNFTGSSMNRTRVRMSCREATEASEKVRQFANLAIWATKRLQDLSYARMYQKVDYYEENELILKLAWFLDQLAILTGYEPNYRRYKPVNTTPMPTTSPMTMTLVPQNQELIDNLVTCMKSHSSLAAPERCRYSPPLTQLTPESSTTSSPQMDSTMITSSPSDSVTAQSMELLITGDANRTPRRITKRSTHGHEYFVPIGVHEKPKPVVDFFVKKLSNLKAIVKSVKKNALADFSSQLALHKHIHKRAIDDKMSMYAVLNRLSNVLSAKSNDKSVDPIVKNEVPTVNSDGLSVKKDKSVFKYDLPAVKSGDVIVVAPILYPVSDVSVVNTKSFKKRSIIDNSYIISKLTNSPVTTAVKYVKKRSVNDPLEKFASYYLKYKAWDGSNQIYPKNNNSPTNYDVSNSLRTKILTKRSTFHKKNSHFKIFKPLHMFKPYNKYSIKKGKSKLLSYMNNILKKKHKFSQKNLHKIYKRSLHYERMYLPRIPTDPTGDISYYAKNKRGRNYNPNLVQAGLLRLSLESTFANGNIAVIQRYGSNYNPAVPDVFTAGILRSSADS